MKDAITPMLITFNEAPNIRRTLEKLSWARRILVVDSFSTDETLEIVTSFPQALVVQRKFDSFAEQCNFGLKQISTEWVLSMDADYVLSGDLIEEIKRLAAPCATVGYSVNFQYCVYGRPLRSTIYPPRTVLYQREKAVYHNEGHGHRVRVQGPVARLQGCILHDDRKPLDRWFQEQIRYSKLDAAYLLSSARRELNHPDRTRLRMLPAPCLVFFYTLLCKRLILDGWPGWFYVCQRTFAELLLSLRLMEARLSKLASADQSVDKRLDQPVD